MGKEGSYRYIRISDTSLVVGSSASPPNRKARASSYACAFAAASLYSFLLIFSGIALKRGIRIVEVSVQSVDYMH
jgi:hypothetical protein